MRSEYRNKRRAIKRASARVAARKLASYLHTNRHFRDAKKIAAYLASDGEIDLTPSIRLAWRAGKQVYVPVLDKKGAMRFVRYRSNSTQDRAAMGLSEPKFRDLLPRQASLDLVLVPLVAFDHEGRRLGRGGGHYDRYFQNQHLKRNRSLLMGVGHHCQQTARLTSAPWDVQLHAIATDRGIRYFRKLQ